MLQLWNMRDKYEEPHWITKKGQSKEKEAEEEKRKGHPHPFTYSRIGFSLFLFLFVNVLFVYFFLSFNSFHQVFTEHLYMPVPVIASSEQTE